MLAAVQALLAAAVLPHCPPPELLLDQSLQVASAAFPAGSVPVQTSSTDEIAVFVLVDRMRQGPGPVHEIGPVQRHHGAVDQDIGNRRASRTSSRVSRRRPTATL